MGSSPCAMVVVEVKATRLMHAFCRFFRGKRHCGGKLTDVTHTAEEETPIIMHAATNSSQHHDPKTTTWFYGKTELERGDASRNVIELIFRATTTETTRCAISIEQVLKLNHSRETLERFESFREGVKNRAHMHYSKHPRNMVDGNEQLLFCGTKLTDCKQFGSSELCRDSDCGICSIFRSGFYTTKKKSGIWLSSRCQDLVTGVNTNREMMNLKMAIIVCRVIAGRTIDMLDKDFEDDYDSVRGVKSNYMFVRNPSAVLPCFVIILNYM